MGPWQVYSEALATAPGLSFERVREMVLRGRITRETVLRGPSTRQFWAFACNAQGIAVLLGLNGAPLSAPHRHEARG